MNGKDFDNFTVRLAQGRSSIKTTRRESNWIDIFIHWLFGRKRKRTHDSFRRTSGDTEATILEKRIEFIKSRQSHNIQPTKINPRTFLEKLAPDSRKEFLSILSESQRTQFMTLNSSTDFFNILTSDQRVQLAVNFSPRFLNNGIAAVVGPAIRKPGLYGDAGTYTEGKKRLAILSKILGTKTKKNTSLGNYAIAVSQYNFCHYAGLQWDTCYYSYQSTIETDRDGSPCTYGPYPCGSSFPPNPPGKQFESSFCPGVDADNFGCGTLAYQFTNVTACPHQASLKGVPLENICNATNNVDCSYSDVSSAKFTSVVTNCEYPNTAANPKRCIIDSYIDPQTGDKIMVPVKTDIDGCSPCIQQSGPLACDGIDCPCPGLYISQTGYRSPGYGSAQMNPNNYVNGLLIPYISVPKGVYNACGLKTGMLALASVVMDASGNPTENPNDWVAGVLAEDGGPRLGEVSYAMWDALGAPSDSVKVNFRIYPQVNVGWPVSRNDLNAFKNKYLGICCPGNIDDQCHSKEERGYCVTDTTDPNVNTCHCQNGWLPDINGDCTWYCPGSNPFARQPGTDSGSEECSGNGRCEYERSSETGDMIGECRCDDGWWSFIGDKCNFVDCVNTDDWLNPSVQPCYGHGDCNPGASQNVPGTCTCDDGWSNGEDGLAYCTEKTCHHDCSGHGDCMQFPFSDPFCICDIDHGWFGEDCSRQGCLTQNGQICSGHGECKHGDDGQPVCNCYGEWGGGVEIGNTACTTRKCPGCPEGFATCTEDWNWYEIFGLCIFGDHCEKNWNCHCNDSSLRPPACSSKLCCDGFWGECSKNMRAQGGGGGGICLDNGQCSCFDGYDPSRCCAYPLPGFDFPEGYGKACYGIAERTINLTCSGLIQPCGSCGATQFFNSWILQPDGNNKFHDDVGNLYVLDPSVCKLSITKFGETAWGNICGSANDKSYWLVVNGSSGVGVTDTLCQNDCTDCRKSVGCNFTVQ
jgi:hypothetical protein